MKPEILSHKKVYDGKVFDVFLSKIREGAVEYERDIISHHGSAVILPVFADQTIALVKQYRHAAGEYLLEIPAGSLNENESPEMGARRELEEEIGVVAGKIEKLAEFYVSPGFLAEKMFVFLATDLSETVQNLEEDELIEIKKITFPKAFEMIKTGDIEDAKSIIGLILAGIKFGFVYE
ncbi:MAG: NUDIX hydrolase [Acidobacteriota bacterium]|jgi:ADP-ribose pyrophosphatase|nr:NUDIX hydrolase [Acidobacteriota bacterium]